MGAGIEVAKYKEKLVPSTRFVSVDGIAPTVSGANSFVAPSASVVGRVLIGEHSR
jgi:carbonic anhydrase/acetyltransferase-like protein (isoleucine patch superfamily)